MMNEEIVLSLSPSSLKRGFSLLSRARMLLRRNSESFMAENLLRPSLSLSLSLSRGLNPVQREATKGVKTKRRIFFSRQLFVDKYSIGERVRVTSPFECPVRFFSLSFSLSSPL